MDFLEAVQKTLIKRFGIEAKRDGDSNLLFAWLRGGHIAITDGYMNYRFNYDNTNHMFNFNIADPAFDPEQIFSMIEENLPIEKW